MNWTQFFQLFLSLSILIILHELGHFLPAKWFKTRVEKFYLFFDPYFKIFSKKIGDTEYGIGWLPLGGYVKISGMIDESMDKEQMALPPQPWEFRSKPAWQRLIIMLGGVTVNFILGWLIFSMIFKVWGESYIPTTEAKYGIHVDSLGKKIGLQNGDIVTAVGTKKLDRFGDRAILKEVVINGANTITVQRDGVPLVITIPEEAKAVMSSHKMKDQSLFMPRLPIVVGKVQDGTPAKKAGITAQDQIIGLNNESTVYFDEFKSKISNLKSQPVTVKLLRNSDTISLNMTTTAEGTIGFAPMGPDHFFKLSTDKFGLVESMQKGWNRGYGFLSDQLKAFGQIFKGKIKAKDSLGGFISFYDMFPKSWDWELFWTLTASISIILAFMNLLPIPGLDGGYVMFLLWEVATGKKVSDKFMEKAVTVGFFLLLSLLLYANGLDIMRKWFN
jgi:regulator of sigma E protease